jgi:hypothetical protein
MFLYTIIFILVMLNYDLFRTSLFYLFPYNLFSFIPGMGNSVTRRPIFRKLKSSGSEHRKKKGHSKYEF